MNTLKCALAGVAMVLTGTLLFDTTSLTATATALVAFGVSAVMLAPVVGEGV